MSHPGARIFVFLQHVLPKHAMTALVFRLARLRWPRIKNFLIRQFVTLYKVDVSEAAHPVPEAYPTFNDFFTRELSASARPIDRDDKSIVSPVDGTVSAAGRIDDSTIVQAKGLGYTLNDLLMTDTDDTQGFRGGDFITIYLAPYNYHRVHAPLDGSIVAARYVPGDLYSVNESTVSLLRGLFTRNERLICHFDTPSGPMILVFVGALHVGSIDTPWTGQLRPERKGMVRAIDLDTNDVKRQVSKGGLLGWFNMGSTVIVLTPPDTWRFQTEVLPGATVQMGQAIGHRREAQ